METMVPPAPAPAGSKRWIAGIGLVLAGIVGLAAWAIGSPDAVAYYKTPSELGSATTTADQRIRLGGRMVDGSLERSGSSVSFEVTDGSEQIAVAYTGEVPDTLKDGSDVIAEGRYTANGFEADKLMAKCSSKFVPKDKQEHLGRT